MFYGDIKKLGEHDYADKHNFYAQIFLLNVILYQLCQTFHEFLISVLTGCKCTEHSNLISMLPRNIIFFSFYSSPII